VIHEVRLPRVVAGVLIGAAVATAGALMQEMTRNPLASPELMGLNAGGQFLLVVALVFLPSASYLTLIVASSLGAALGAGLVVYGIGSLSRGGLTPVKLALAGVAVSMLLSALTSGLMIFFDRAQDLLFFLAGGVGGMQWTEVRFLVPWFSLGLLGALIISSNITVLSLGDDVARGLGQRTAAEGARVTHRRATGRIRRLDRRTDRLHRPGDPARRAVPNRLGLPLDRPLFRDPGRTDVHRGRPGGTHGQPTL
jgi:iron complex transport system permease protein